MTNGMTKDVPTGQIEVTPHDGGGWFLVQIGREKYTKRLNVRRTELEQLVEWCAVNLGQPRTATPPES